MGTPAFPNLGKHCSVDDCKLIDFLPFTCDCCNKVIPSGLGVSIDGGESPLINLETSDDGIQRNSSEKFPEFGPRSGEVVTNATNVVSGGGSRLPPKVFCLEHRSYTTHKCPNANKNDRTVVICPLCAKGVHLVPEQDPNITWESHVNTDCDPLNYEKVTKRKKCPVRGCREILTFSNTIQCRDCTIDHCLKHRLGLDHSCPGPKKSESTFSFWGFSNSQKQNTPQTRTTTGPVSSSSSSSSWSTSLINAVSSLMLSDDRNSEVGRKGGSSGGGAGGQVEQCPICNMKFSKVAALIDHVQMIHEKKGLMKVTVDVCPKCSKGFRDPVALVEHVEREHRGISKA